MKESFDEIETSYILTMPVRGAHGFAARTLNTISVISKMRLYSHAQ
jgi:hypothetical protein